MKKIGSDLDLKGIVIHQVLKAANDRNVTVKKATSVIKLGDKEINFVGKLNIAYYKKSRPTYGIFGDANPKFKTLLNNYLLNDNLLDFSTNATEYYKSILEKTITATGGFLVFIDYTNTEKNNRYLLTFTIANKDGYAVSETDLTLQDIKNLDLDKVDVACMINLTKWKSLESGGDAESMTYLSFVKGNKSISYYFMTFIDCENKTTSTDSTRRLTRAINDFADFKSYDRETKIRKRNEIYQYCEDCIKIKREINLSSISAIFDPENTNEFSEFAASEEYAVNEIINPDKAQLKKMKFAMYKDENYRIEFDLSLLGKEVIYNKQKKELTFKKLPDELINQIS